MKKLILMLFLFIPILLKAQSETGFGVVIERIDSAIVKNVQVVNFENYKGYIFPKEYGYEYFRKKKECIDLDTSLIKEIDNELVEQYFQANRRYMEILNAEMYTMKETNPKAHKLKRLRKEEKRFMNDFDESEHVWIDQVKFSQRQYLGFVNEKGEKIIYIQLVDFREDPHGLKKYIDKQFISGWHGWFYSNINQVYYHIDSRKLTVSDDY